MPRPAQPFEQSLPGAQVSDTHIGFHCFDISPALIKTWSAAAFISFSCLEPRRAVFLTADRVFSDLGPLQGPSD